MGYSDTQTLACVHVGRGHHTLESRISPGDVVQQSVYSLGGEERALCEGTKGVAYSFLISLFIALLVALYLCTYALVGIPFFKHPWEPRGHKTAHTRRRKETNQK